MQNGQEPKNGLRSLTAKQRRNFDSATASKSRERSGKIHKYIELLSLTPK